MELHGDRSGAPCSLHHPAGRGALLGLGWGPAPAPSSLSRVVRFERAELRLDPLQELCLLGVGRDRHLDASPREKHVCHDTMGRLVKVDEVPAVHVECGRSDLIEDIVSPQGLQQGSKGFEGGVLHRASDRAQRMDARRPTRESGPPRRRGAIPESTRRGFGWLCPRFRKRVLGRGRQSPVGRRLGSSAARSCWTACAVARI